MNRTEDLMEVLEFHGPEEMTEAAMSDAVLFSVCSVPSEKLFRIVDGGVGATVASQVREEVGG